MSRITVPTDVLSALAGLANYFREQLGLPERGYLAGLWAEDLLPVGLGWYGNWTSSKICFRDFVEHLDDPKPFITPSWSPLRRYEGGDRAWQFGGGVCTHLPK